MVRGAVLLLLAVPLASAGDAPSALVLEHDDPHVHALGGAALLREAGFEVATLDPVAWPKSISADLILLGTFCTERPEAREALRAHKDALLEFVRRGGVLLEMTQEDGTQSVPPFLPEGAFARRSDRDYTDLLALDPGHPLLEGLLVTDGGASRLEAPERPSGRPSWESFWRADGFAVLLASFPEGDAPALLEAAVGSGRLLLASLCLDKVVAADGKPVVSEQYRAVSRTFFGNLRRYVTLVGEGRAPAVEPFSPYTLPPGRSVDLGWRLAPSDAATYAATMLSSRGEQVPHVSKATRMVFGHDLRDAGQYRTAMPRLADLAAILALRVAPAAPEREVPLDDASELRVRGVPAAVERGEGIAVAVAQYAFQSAGKASRDKHDRVQGGEAKVRLEFDRKEGVVRHARAELRYTLLRAGGAEKPVEVREELDLRLDRVRRARHRGFQPEVDAAITKGLGHLGTLQKPDGTFEPHGDWTAGTTALALLTLLSCDVSRDEPAAARALAWLCAQEPRRTYEQALGLMALERAYPAGRDMPDHRRAWCARTLTALERGCGSPGSWSYPPGSWAVVRFDSSNTQYGALGLHAAARLGLPVKEAMWTGLVRHFAQVRERDGASGRVGLVRQGEAVTDSGPEPVAVPEVLGFRYWPGEHRAWASMTCAGIASLALARHELRRLRRLPPQLEKEIDAMILGGWAWLDAHWGMDRHPGKRGDDWYGYYLYSLERAAVLDGVKRVGQRDWYYEGALQLLERQGGGGGWDEQGSNVTCGTCFALLFLKKATQPISGSAQDRD